MSNLNFASEHEYYNEYKTTKTKDFFKEEEKAALKLGKKYLVGSSNKLNLFLSILFMPLNCIKYIYESGNGFFSELHLKKWLNFVFPIFAFCSMFIADFIYGSILPIFFKDSWIKNADSTMFGPALFFILLVAWYSKPSVNLIEAFHDDYNKSAQAKLIRSWGYIKYKDEKVAINKNSQKDILLKKYSYATLHKLMHQDKFLKEYPMTGKKFNPFKQGGYVFIKNKSQDIRGSYEIMAMPNKNELSKADTNKLATATLFNLHRSFVK